MAKDILKEVDIHLKYPLSQVIRDVWGYAEGFRGRIILYFVFVAVVGLGLSVPPYFIGLIIDALHLGDYTHVPTFLGVIAGSYVVALSLRHYLIYKTRVLASQLVNQTRIKTINHLFSLDFAFYESTSLGTILARAETGARSLHDLFRILYSTTLQRIVVSITSFVIIVKLNMTIGIVAAVFLTAFILSHVYTNRMMLKLEGRVFAEGEKVYGKVYDFLRHIQIVKLLNVKDRLINVLRKSYAVVLQEERARRRFERVKNAIFANLLRLSEVGVLGFLAYEAMQGALTVGLAIAIWQYFARLNEQVDSALGDFQELVPVRTALYRLHLISDVQPTIKDPVKPKSIPSQWKHIRFDSVSFTYQTKHKRAVDDVSFKIKRGERVAIVGATGSGKSTIAKLLLKLYLPQAGQILFNETPIAAATTREVTSRIKIVPQENELINTSVYHNLQIAAQGKLTREQAIAVLRQAASETFVKKLPQGIDTLVGPEGIKLSGGEKQRICLARALVSKPELLVLDEATSHLDVVTEREVYEHLKKLSRAVTVLAITHRVSSMYLFDRILVMSHGELVGDGTHTELLRTNKYYQKLWKSGKHH